MSTWNNCIKRFDNNKVIRLEHLFYVLGQEGWDNLTKEIEDETDGRITTVFTDEVRGVKSRYNSEDGGFPINSYVSIESSILILRSI